MKIFVTQSLIALLFLSSCGSRPFTYDSSTSDVQTSASIATQPDLNSNRAMCSIISAEACSQLFSETLFKGVKGRALSRSDVIMLQNFTSIDVKDIETMTDRMADEESMKALGSSGFNLGRKLGTAVEQARRQQVLADFHDLFDRSFRFDLSMVESPEGRIIVPPIIDRLDNTSRISDDGRQIQIVDIVYTIRKNARFTIIAPSWRDYLMAPIDYPSEYDLVNAVLPETEKELAYWRDRVVEGYLVGIDLARESYSRRYARLEADYVGMQRYHLLRAFNMVSEPIVNSDVYVATGSRDGTKLNLDDANLSIEVVPNMITQATLHRAIPRIRDFEHYAIDDDLLPAMELDL